MKGSVGRNFRNTQAVSVEKRVSHFFLFASACTETVFLNNYGKKMEQELFDPYDVISCHKEEDL